MIDGPVFLPRVQRPPEMLGARIARIAQKSLLVRMLCRSTWWSWWWEIFAPTSLHYHMVGCTKDLERRSILFCWAPILIVRYKDENITASLRWIHFEYKIACS